MSGKNPHMNPLVSRKKLLVAESDLNRAQLFQEWRTMVDEVRTLTKRARTVGTIASAAASLAAGVMSFRRKKSASADEKPSWLQTVLKGAGLVSTLWQTFRPLGHEQKDK
jgi:hypothetical protein